MKNSKRELDAIMDRVTDDIRNEALSPAASNEVSDRVRLRLTEQAVSVEAGSAQVDQIRGCGDFQSLIPTYLRGGLSSARAMLLEDHTLECLPCRKALKEARSGRPAASGPPMPLPAKSPALPWTLLRWGVAAVLVLGVAAAASLLLPRYFHTGEPFQAEVQAADGSVFRLSDTKSSTLGVGAKLQTNEPIRTARNARAMVRLADGSVVEMKERSQISLSESNRGVTIRLQQGNIIVQAAKQRPRHLYVATDDCLVSVTGTIFSVNSGTKGSRVSVLEGEVHVDHAGQDHILHPGDQLATQANLEAVPLQEEISWSRDADRYSKILAELSSIRKEIDQTVARPEIRYNSRLLDRMPEGTVFYVAIPNLSAMLNEADRILEERIQQNPALQEWWKKDAAASDHGSGLGRVMGRIREFGSYLGEEVVIGAEMNDRGEPDTPVFLAELKDPAGFRAYVQQQADRVHAGAEHDLKLILTDQTLPTAPADTPDRNSAEVYLSVRDHLLVASLKLPALNRLASTSAPGAANPFRQSAFYASIAKVYQEGAGMIIAADLEKIIAHASRGDRQAAAFQRLGLASLRHFIMEVREEQGETRHRAVLTFDEHARGIASWLAPPGPMGALDFISADANVVTAFVVNNPVAVVDELLDALNTLDPSFGQNFNNFEIASGVQLRTDIAEPLGGEFAFAVDGPVLPTPSWKLIFEVYDPAHLQQSLERVVESLNQWAAVQGRTGLQWDRAEVDGRTYYTLRSPQLGVELNYTYVDGFMVAAPSRALVERALQYKTAGYTILRSARFMSSLPEDGRSNFSALFYQNLAPVVGPLASRLGRGTGPVRGDGREVLRSLATSAPALAYAYAEGDRILFAANTHGGPFGLSPSDLLGLPGSLGLGRLFGQAVR